MRKLSSLAYAVLLGAIIFSSCSDSEKNLPGEAFSPDAVYTMQLGHAQATTSPRHLSTLKFKELVETRTNGAVIVEVYPSGQLGNEMEMTEAVSMGTLTAVRGGDTQYLPQKAKLALPMLCDTMEEVHKLCYSDFVIEMLDTVEEHNMKVLAVGDDSGLYQITNNIRPIKTPEDIEGLKIRTAIEITALSLRGFGASTVAIPFTELYMSLRTKAADGQVNPLALLVSQKLYEVQKYCTIIDLMFTVEVMFINIDWYKSIPVEYQAILDDCAREMMDETSRIVEENNEKYIETIQNNGCEMYILSKEERETFRPYAEEVWKTYIEMGRMTREDLNAILGILGKSVDW